MSAPAGVAITFFTNYAATSKREETISLAELGRRIQTRTAAAKDLLPWLKLARFGDIRTKPNAEGKGGNSLRHNANLLAVTGIEADYDNERLGVDVALRLLAHVGVLAIVYTSPSHTLERPRWRILAPFSREYPPEQRDVFMGRLAGLFWGIFAPESWVLSQSYFYGSVNRNPSHRVALLDGTPIDRRADLDELAISRPVTSTGKGTSVPAGELRDTPAPEISDKRVAALIAQLLDNVSTAPDQQKHYALWRNGKSLGGYLWLTNWADEQAIEALLTALEACNSPVRDWAAARKTAADAIAAGKAKPQTLPDRPRAGGRAAA